VPGAGISNYLLFAAPDRRSIILLHGNTDAGPFPIEQALVKAAFIPVETSFVYSLSRLLQYAFEHYEPNHWGLT
jgi:hypothetical protein